MTKFFRNIRQWLANRSVTIEIKGQVEGALVQSELKRIETKLSGRIDALEQYVEDVMEKYLRKISAREQRAAQKEQELVIEPTNAFDVIRSKYGGEK